MPVMRLPGSNLGLGASGGSMFEEEGPPAALTWVAVHPRFESAPDPRAELIRHLGAQLL